MSTSKLLEEIYPGIPSKGAMKEMVGLIKTQHKIIGKKFLRGCVYHQAITSAPKGFGMSQMEALKLANSPYLDKAILEIKEV
jgi:hypothetical protein